MLSTTQQVKVKRRQFVASIVERIVAKVGQDNFAYLCVTISALLYPLVYVYVSMHNFNPIEYNIARGASNFIYGYITAQYFGIDTDFKYKKDNKYLMIRAGIIFIQQIAYIFMHYVVSISILNILNISSVIFSFLIDYLINHTQITKKQFWGIVFGFTGIILTVNSQFLMTIIDPTYVYTSKFQHFIVHDISVKILFSFLFLIVTCLWSFALTIQKKIKRYSSIQINHHLNIVFIVFSGALYPTVVTDPINLIQFGKGMAVSGSLIFFTNTLFTTGFSNSKNTGILTLLTSCTIITSYFVSIFVYDQKMNLISTTGLIILGYGLLKVVLN